MLTTLYAALVVCSVELESDDTYFAVCEGRRSLMAVEAVKQVETGHMGTFCVAYDYEELGDSATFVIVCD